MQHHIFNCKVLWMQNIKKTEKHKEKITIFTLTKSSIRSYYTCYICDLFKITSSIVKREKVRMDTGGQSAVSAVLGQWFSNLLTFSWWHRTVNFKLAWGGKTPEKSSPKHALEMLHISVSKLSPMGHYSHRIDRKNDLVWGSNNFEECCNFILSWWYVDTVSLYRFWKNSLTLFNPGFPWLLFDHEPKLPQNYCATKYIYWRTGLLSFSKLGATLVGGNMTVNYNN